MDPRIIESSTAISNDDKIAKSVLDEQQIEYENAIAELQKHGHELLRARRQFPTYSDILSSAANACFGAASRIYNIGEEAATRIDLDE